MYSFLRCSFLFLEQRSKIRISPKGCEIWSEQIWDACRKDLKAPQREEKERKMEYESEREMAIAYRMHNKGYDIGYIAATLDESEQTIEQWIYDEDRARGREEGMQLLAQVALMLLDEERYEDLKKLGDERFRDQVIEEYEKKKQEETGTPEPR